MRERMKKKKNMIIGGLVALIFVMSVGYAAFATNLNISGTANTSSWIIKITNIREKTHTGGADTENTSFTDLSASFSSTLTQPGDSITYEVTVENQGNIDASLKKVTKTFTQNKYIDVTYSGLLEGQMLYKQGGAGSTAVMEVTVTFKDIEIESLTETITSNITISLDFAQEGNNVDTTKKYLITYDTQGGTPVESRYYKWTDSDIAHNIRSTKLGYNLAGFEVNSSYASAVTPTKTVADLIIDENMPGITLYAVWIPKQYTINFDSQGGSEVQPESGTSWNATNIGRTASSKQWYNFDDWYSQPNGQGLKVTGGVPLSAFIQDVYGKNNDVAGGTNGNEITLYANWTPKEYTINFDSQGGSAVASRTYKSNEAITLPEEPTREGYTFGGWWTKAANKRTGKLPADAIECTNGTTIPQINSVASNLTIDLYAFWQKI